MNAALTLATVEFTAQNVQATLAALPVAKAGHPNLRVIAGELEVSYRGLTRDVLVTAIESVIVDRLAAMAPPPAAPSDVASDAVRWSNKTIRPEGDTSSLVETVWNLLNSDGGVSITDLAKVMDLNRATVSGRLFTLSGNGMVVHTNRPDAMNRPVAYYRAAAKFTKDDMARKLLKVTPSPKAPAVTPVVETAVETAPNDETPVDGAAAA